ncbi:GTPase [Micromonospora cremea]|uniref:50S ribosome-binding GTPase n=1 Tax=Micromonospora cremea TaxID=709881 RepID=A0A1N5TYK2_9ACTN|nr:GTPase [Micromonospora cremea]SIM53564.1 50S ribosome-binding GTPase [Micromonospora cremea]
MTTPDPSITALQAACRDAVARSRPEAERLRRRLERVIADLGTLASDCTDEGVRQLLRVEVDVAALSVDKFRQIVDERLTEVGDFTVVMFGRTGAGKTTLINAFVSGDGSGISPGENDWTVEVADVTWPGGVLVDTPGILGWGRANGVEELREQAYRGLIRADLVLLCFDTSNATAAEFDQVARWVANYGKHAVAVLNVREHEWRRPDRVPRLQGRLDMSQDVADHAERVRAELAVLGLPDVPVVAVSSMRAAFARGDVYLGPAAETRDLLRRRFGTSTVLTWSNLHRLELLLTETIREHAVALRLGSQQRQIAGEAHALAATWHDLAVTAAGAAATVEDAINQIQLMVGDPALLGPDAMNPATALGRLVRRLRELERGRGEPLSPGGQGSISLYAENLVGAKLGAVRAEARAQGELIVDRLMAKGEVADAATLLSQILPHKAIDDAVTEVGQTFAEHVKHRLNVVAKRMELATGPASRYPLGVDGKAGRRLRGAGYAVPGAIAIGAVAAAVLLGPVGILAGAVAGLLGDLIGRFLRSRAAQKLEESRAAAKAQVRAAIESHFDELERELCAELVLRTVDALAAQVTGLIDVGLAVHALRRRSEAHVGRLRKLTDELAAERVTRTLAARTAARLAAAWRMDDRQCRHEVWLGEDWCADPAFLSDTDTDDYPPAEPFPAEHRLVGPRTGALLTRIAGSPPPGSARTWLDSLTGLSGDFRARDVLRELTAASGGRPPRIVLCGDYSSGKTSFVRRLFREAGAAVPDGLVVGAAPTTDHVRVYAWESYSVIDTPGFQSGTEAHRAAARVALEQADLIVYLFTPNITVGDRAELQALLLGDPEAGLTAKHGRCLFVIHRVDEIGIDPIDAPLTFAARCRRRERELSGELTRLMTEGGADPGGIAEQVVSMAADPFRYARGSQDWDGFADLVEVLRDRRAALAANGTDAAVLHLGVARFTALRQEAQAQEAAISARAEQRAMLAADAEQRTDAADVLAAQRRLALSASLNDLVDRLLMDCEQATTPERKASVQKMIKELDTHPEALQIIDEWRTATRSAIEAWGLATAAVVDRRTEQADFRAAFETPQAAVSAGFLGRHGALLQFGDLGRLSALVGRLAKAAPVVAKAGRFATLLGRVARVAPYLGVVTTFADLGYSWMKEGKSAKAREKGLKELREVVELRANGIVDSEPQLAELGAQRAALAELSADLRGEGQHDQRDLAEAQTRAHRYAAAADSAAAHLSKGSNIDV